jgi:uncharacterized protein YndB with AHSA1/START domain
LRLTPSWNGEPEVAVTEVTEKAVLRVPLARVWDVISATHRYADWVHGVLEVTDHHGVAEVGKTYSERNRTVGPLTTRSTWTVQEIVPMSRRVDAGTGFAPMHDMVNIFEFKPTEGGTEMTFTVRYRPGLGPIGKLIDKLQQPGLRKSFQASMRNLEELVVAEGELD